MKIKNKKLNNKGFSHVEMLLLVVALVIVGGIGFYVYKQNNKTTTAHAGSWQSIGTVTSSNPYSSVSRFACMTGPIVSAGNSLANVKGLLVANKTTKVNNFGSGALQIIDFSGPNQTGNILSESISTQWVNGTLTNNGIWINPSIKNYVDFRVVSSVVSGSPILQSFSASKNHVEEIYFPPTGTIHSVSQC